MHRSELSPWKAWLLAIRPRTLPAAVGPVLVGTALAVRDNAFTPLPAIAALVGALLIQIGANLSNDYLDYVKGADVAERTGPRRMAQSGLIALPRLRVGIAVTFALAAMVGLYLISVGGWPVLAIGLASLLSALAYTGGPWPVGYHGLGDLFVFLFFGLAAVCGTYYVQALSISPLAVAAALPVGALTVAILVVNNLRDIETDRKTGKRTLAVILGPETTRMEYVLLLVLAYTTPLLFKFAGWSSSWVLLPWASLPLAVHLVRSVYQVPGGPALNKMLAGTANLDLLFCVFFATGLVL
ncbi:MAG: 1,4-dihydroxy-2-naphthoate polyprenyltransferase [Anaerolineae bacterium]|jgi:1,4-dihydroxy-2-naphthoate octaprenyltransferase